MNHTLVDASDVRHLETKRLEERHSQRLFYDSRSRSVVEQCCQKESNDDPESDEVCPNIYGLIMALEKRLKQRAPSAIVDAVTTFQVRIVSLMILRCLLELTDEGLT